jgi:hypothetical protein
MSKAEKKNPKKVKLHSHVIPVDENGNRIQPPWVEQWKKLSPKKKAMLKMRIEELYNQFEIRDNEKIN